MDGNDNKTVIGVTGGLATGKTTVTEMLVSKGAYRIDADVIAHELLDGDEDIIRAITDRFKEDVMTGGRLDRRKLAGRVFFDKDDLDFLCSVLHPPVISRMIDMIRGAENKVIVLDAPLLIEAGISGLADVLLVVKAERNTQIERAKARGISEEEAERILDRQMPISEKEIVSDYVIDNDLDDKEQLRKGVDKIWQEILNQKKS